MKIKEIFINSFIFVFSIYLPMFLFSFYIYKNNSYSKFHQNSKDLEILKVKLGFLPIFWPDEILKNNKTNFYPIGSLQNRWSYFCNEGYGLISYKTDRFGLRNRDNKWNNVINKSNIFLVGDSFTQGACVNEKSTIDYHIENNTKINTINIGTGSNGPYEYQAIIKSILKPIIEKSNKKNFVILNFYPNDNLPINKKKEKLLQSTKSIVNLKSNGDVTPIEKYNLYMEKLIKDNYPLKVREVIKEIENNKLITFKQSSFYQIFSLLPVRRAIRVILINSKFLDYYQKTNSPSLETINHLAKDCNKLCKPVVTYIPPSNFWTGYLNANKFKSDLKKVSQKNKILFIDGEEVISRNNIKNYAPKGEHLSLEGYFKLSELINERILK